MRRVLSLALMLAVVIGSQYLIARERSDVTVRRESLAGNPVDHYAAVGPSQGVVLVVHGFGGSKESMQYWGYALARQGFEAYLPDQPGHGEQRVRLPAWEELEKTPLGDNLRHMVAELSQTGRARPGKIALVGHSMGGDAVLAAGLEETGVAATVTIPGRNQLAILYDQEVMAAALDWIHRELATEPRGPVEVAVPWGWILLGLAGGLGALVSVAAMVRPPEVRSGGRSRPLGFGTGLVALSVALLSAVLAAVYLRLPQLGISLLDYLLPYFLVASGILLLLRGFWPQEFAFPLTRGAQGLTDSVLRGLLVSLVYLGAVVPVIHMNLTSQLPVTPRLLPFLVSFAILWPYFVQEEGLKQAVAGQRGPLAGLALGVLARLVMVATWFGATALPNPPPFLHLVIPVALLLLLALELMGALLSYLRFSPAATATMNAVVLAWSMVTTLPLN